MPEACSRSRRFSGYDVVWPRPPPRVGEWGGACLSPMRSGQNAAGLGRVSGGNAVVLEACIELESDPALVGVARHFVDQTVVEWELDPIREDARLIATELASNAVLHARTEFRLTLRSNGFDFLRIEVRDENTRMPSPAGTPQDATSGRGLAVVTAIAASWGTQRDGDGKVVWAEIGRTKTSDQLECLSLGDLAVEQSMAQDADPEMPPAGEAVAL